MTNKNLPVWQRTLHDNWFYLLVLVFLVAFPFIVGWLTDSSPFGVQRGSRTIMRGESAVWMSIGIEIFVLAILVMSYNLMFGFTGVISFGHALFFGIGGYAVGMFWELTPLNANLAFFLSILTVLALTGGAGLLMGLATLRLRGVYFAIFTLAVAQAVWTYISRWSVTGGEDGFSLGSVPVWLDTSQTRLNVYYFGLLLFVITFLVIRRLIASPAGTVFQAIRENEERAQTIGYNTLRYKLLSITVASMLAGMAGVLQALQNKKIGPEFFDVTVTVDALLMNIIGGVGTFIGPVLGAGTLHLIEDRLRDAELMLGTIEVPIGEYWLLIEGIIFVVVVLIFPTGIAGTWYAIRNRVGKTFSADEKPADVELSETATDATS